MTIYELAKWHRHHFEATEETVAFYASWKDANLRKRYCEMNDNGVYEYQVYTCKVIPDSEESK